MNIDGYRNVTVRNGKLQNYVNGGGLDENANRSVWEDNQFADGTSGLTVDYAVGVKVLGPDGDLGRLGRAQPCAPETAGQCSRVRCDSQHG